MAYTFPNEVYIHGESYYDRCMAVIEKSDNINVTNITEKQLGGTRVVNFSEELPSEELSDLELKFEYLLLKPR